MELGWVKKGKRPKPLPCKREIPSSWAIYHFWGCVLVCRTWNQVLIEEREISNKSWSYVDKEYGLRADVMSAEQRRDGWAGWRRAIQRYLDGPISWRERQGDERSEEA
mmetsp:Transcript_13151/g.26692  ORF Transcript_13151/g.26692 Transcript_13151/m.26692 type:complete len:108 (-) Transcript_13151:198-521(-)